MKYAITITATLAAFPALLAGFAIGAADAKRPSANFDEITARRIVVRSADGKQSVTISAMHDSVGIWVGGGKSDSDSVAILSRHSGGKLGPGVVINHPSMLEKIGSGSPLAFTLNDKGHPQIQTVKDGKIKIQELHK